MRQVLPLRATAMQGSMDPAAIAMMTAGLPSIPTAPPGVIGRTVRGMVPPVSAQLPQDAQRLGRSILPRALHAARRFEEPERAGATIAGLAAQRAVSRGFGAAYGLGGLGATPGCTSTGARVAQEILAGSGTLLTTLSAAQVGSSPTANRNLAVAGASVSMVGGVYAGACEARTGTQTTSYASQAVQTGANIFAQIQSARNGTQNVTAQPDVSTDGTGLTPDQAGAQTAANAAAAANGNPNQAPPPAEQPAADASSNTTLYIAGGVAAAVILAALLLK